MRGEGETPGLFVPLTAYSFRCSSKDTIKRYIKPICFELMIFR